MSVEQSVHGFDDGGAVIDLREILETVWSGKWLFMACVVAIAALFTVAAFIMTPVYRATTVLVPVERQAGSLNGALGSMLGSLGGLASLAGLGMGGSTDVEEALAVLKSREFTEAFIVDKQLLPLLFAGRWDAQQKTWKGEKHPTLAMGYKVFDRRLRTVTRDKKTGLVTLTIDWRDREQAAEWANEMVARLNAEMRKRALTEAEASVRYLEAEMQATALVGSRDAIGRLIEAQINQRMLANVTREYAFRIADRALPPDQTDPVKPNKTLMLAAGLLVGGVFGLLVVLLKARLWPQPGRLEQNTTRTR